MLPCDSDCGLASRSGIHFIGNAGRPLYYTGVSILHKYGLIRRLNLEEDKLKAYLAQLERTYRPNPYHNNSCEIDGNSHPFLLSLQVMLSLLVSLVFPQFHVLAVWSLSVWVQTQSMQPM